MRQDDETALNDFSSTCSDLISSSKSLYLSNLGNKLNDPMTAAKAYWSILNRFLGKKKIPVILPLLVNGIFETVFSQNQIFLTNSLQINVPLLTTAVLFLT